MLFFNISLAAAIMDIKKSVLFTEAVEINVVFGVGSKASVTA